ncbi:hypothetical protein WMY93_021151 [Mugilogobius chulae]|uniref:F-box domain-containing protein n=1 Tax=Mugilogobius chulae TaxID=88201 RepID=A0AAW0NM91_9GOBI
MEKEVFEGWLESVSATFLTLNDQQRNQALDQLISLSGAVQLRHLSNGLETLLKRDFLRLLPLELAFYLLRWLDPQTLLTCCLVCKQWNKVCICNNERLKSSSDLTLGCFQVISSCTEVWQTVCHELGWRIDESIQDATHWKGVYLKAKRRMMQLKDQEAFETSSLIGHSARVYALYYKDGLLCTVMDVRTGQCIYGIQTHTCATVKFDEQKLVTGSFDNTIACWEWSTGAKTSSSVVTQSRLFFRYCLALGREINCKCLKTLSVSEDRSIAFTRLSLMALHHASLREVIKTQDPANLSLLSFGEVFALLFDNHFLYVMDLRTEAISGRWPLPAYRKSKRGSSFLAGVTSWLNGLDGGNDSGLVFATSMPDHSIHLVLWKENG